MPNDAAQHAYRLVPQNQDPALKVDPILLTEGVTYAGRLADCGIQLPGGLVSRRHAKFIVTDVGATVHDLDSHNGIFINGKKVRSAPLSPGDKVYFANVCVAVEEVPFVEEDFLSANTRDSMLDVDLDEGTAERGLATLMRTTELMSVDDDEIFFNEVMRLLTEMTSAQFTALMRMLPGEGLQESVVAWAPGKMQADVPVFHPAVETAMGNRAPVWPGAPNLPAGLLDNQAPILCLPIMAPPRVLGAIYVQRQSPIPFSKADVDTVTAMAQMLAIRMTGNVGGAHIEEPTQIRQPSFDTVEAERSASQIQQLEKQVEHLTGELQRQAEHTAALDDQLKGAAAVGAQLKKAETELSTSLAKSAELEAKLAQQQADAGASDALEAALQQACAPRLVAHIKQNMGAEPGPRDVVSGTAVALTVQIAALDGWTGSAALPDAQERLDVFSRTLRALVTANHGQVEQVLGHRHLVLFPGDIDGVKRALVCARELLATIPPDGATGVQAAVHLGANLGGFFGDGLDATYLQVGEAVAVSRGALDSPVAQPGTVLVTEAVRTMLAGDAAYPLVALGPSFIKGFNSPFALYQLAGGT